jgi:hypothetical protein
MTGIRNEKNKIGIVRDGKIHVFVVILRLYTNIRFTAEG